MRQFDILAAWLRANPLPGPTTYAEIREQVALATGLNPTNRTLPVTLRDLGYYRMRTTYGTWYGRHGDEVPSIDEQAQDYFLNRRYPSTPRT